MAHESVIQTPRLILRPWRIEDLASLIKLYSDPRVMEFWEVKGFEDTKKDYNHFVQSMKEHGWGFWAVELKEGGEFIGLIGLDNVGFNAHFTPAVEIGWRLHYEFWGKGYATEGAKAALKYGFEEIGLDEIVSFSAVGNTRSRRVMESLGMTYNPKDDFNDPDLDEGHPYRRLVLYRLKKEDWETKAKVM